MAARRTRNNAGIPTARGGRQRRLHEASNPVEETLADPGPWVNVTSTRMTQVRFDYGLRAIFIRFSKTGVVYIYESTPYSVYVRLLRAASKGHFVDRVLNSYPYRPVTASESERPTTHIGAPTV